MEALEKLLEYIETQKIVSPSPRAWNHLWTNIFKGFDEEWESDEERWKYYPQILSAWGVASDKFKNERFVNSIKYFYNKYPNKRKKIERFVLSNDKWFMGWDK